MPEITLKHPLTVGGKTVDKLTMRRATVKDLRLAGRFGSDDEAKEIALLATLTGLVPEDLDGMDLADYKELQSSFRTLLDG